MGNVICLNAELCSSCSELVMGFRVHFGVDTFFVVPVGIVRFVAE